MLKIRPEQIEAFRPVTEAEFAQRFVDHLLTKHPRAVVRLPQGPTLVERLSDALVQQMVRDGIKRARSYGLTWESSISAFVVIMFRVSPNFDLYPAVQRLLTDTETAPEIRLQRILSEMKAEDWEAIKVSYDPGAWQVQDEVAEV